MATFQHAPGLRVVLPDGLELASSPAAPSAVPPATRGPIGPRRPGGGRTPAVVDMPAAASPSPAGESAALTAALQDQDLELVGVVPLQPVPVRRGTRAPAVPASAEVGLEVELASDEGAVVLVEQGGMYTWQFDGEDAELPAPAGGLRRGRREPARRRTFRVRLGAGAGAAKPGAARSRGWVTDLVMERAQAFVFKYAGRFLLQRGAAFLERKVESGLVVMDGDDPTAWRRVPDFAALDLPAGRPLRILLFVHGTFSSTRGGFSGLGATPRGRDFLAAARRSYDAVVGFDHPTLSVDPLVNATALLRAFEARAWTHPVHVDAVSHSRGGITLRSLIEHLLPAASVPVRVQRAVFVAAVNGGTQLAEPGNWKTFLNVYTNLAAGACRAVALFAPATFAATLTGELVQSVGIFARVLAEEAITEQAMPGLSAMQPSGPFITELNRTQPGQATAAASRYYAITSNFRAQLAPQDTSELPKQLLQALADGAVDQLMKVDNDLVVDTGSMTHVDPHAGVFIKDTLAFGTNGVVHHTNYFFQPRVAEALARWFELDLAPATIGAPLRRSLPVPGMLPEPIPARVDTRIVVLGIDQVADEARERIARRSPSYVVVERLHQGRQLHYAFRASEVLDAVQRQPGAPLRVALDLHETEASPEGPLNAVPSPDPGAFRPSLRRAVAMDAGRVVGVAEADLAPVPLAELAAQFETAAGAGAGIPFVPGVLTDLVGRAGAGPVAAPSNPPAAAPPPPAPAAPAPAPVRRTRGATRNLPQDLPVGAAAGAAPPAPAPAPAPEPCPTTRAKPPASAAPPAAPATDKVTCHVLAEMDDQVQCRKPTTVEVTLSREAIQAARTVSASGSGSATVGRQITVELILKKNFTAGGETRVDVDLPEPGVPLPLPFDVVPTDPGEGEIFVRVRQGMQPVANLVLRCTVVAHAVVKPVRRPSDPVEVAEAEGPQPLHQLTIFELERGGKTLYQFILDSPSLGLKNVYESKTLRASAQEFIRGIYADIEQRYLASQKDYQRFQKELRRIGAGLWDDLFPAELQADLWKCREQIGSILVFSEEPFIPWELVHLKEPGKGLPAETRFLGQMGLVRWLHNTGWPPVDLRARPGRCRTVIPAYPHPDYALPGAEAEAAFLKKRFKATPVEPHTEPVEALLEEPGSFDLLHFACHGVADSADIQHAELLLEGRVDGGKYVTETFQESVIQQLSGLVGEEGIRPIVTLNACQAGRAGFKLTRIGGFPHAFLRQGAGMFVAALWAVGDQPARVFTEKLYERLLAGDTLAEAATLARDAARAGQEATWLAYAVYGNPHARLSTK